MSSLSQASSRTLSARCWMSGGRAGSSVSAMPDVSLQRRLGSLERRQLVRTRTPGPGQRGQAGELGDGLRLGLVAAAAEQAENARDGPLRTRTLDQLEPVAFGHRAGLEHAVVAAATPGLVHSRGHAP